MDIPEFDKKGAIVSCRNGMPEQRSRYLYPCIKILSLERSRLLSVRAGYQEICLKGNINGKAVCYRQPSSLTQKPRRKKSVSPLECRHLFQKRNAINHRLAPLSPLIPLTFSFSALTSMFEIQSWTFNVQFLLPTSLSLSSSASLSKPSNSH